MMIIPKELTTEEKEFIRNYVNSEECPECVKKYLEILRDKNKNCMEKVFNYMAINTILYDFLEENGYDDLEELKQDLKENLLKNYKEEIENVKRLLNVD